MRLRTRTPRRVAIAGLALVLGYVAKARTMTLADL